jgi:hypothetical protein
MNRAVIFVCGSIRAARETRETFGLNPVLAEQVVGKIEIALHSLNDSVYGLAGLVPIGSAKLDAPDGPIRFYE